MKNMSIKKATLINACGKYSNVIIQLIINMILARLLVPEDFGIVAIITVFTNFFLILSDMGIGTGIIQLKCLDYNDYNSIYSFSFYLGVVLSFAFCVLGIPIAFIYSEKILMKLCCFLSFSVFFNTINMVPNAILLKNQDFIIVAVRTVFVNIVAGIITVILALLGFKYYSLIINSILISVMTFIVTIQRTKLKFKLKFSYESVKKIKSISSYQFAFSFVNYFSRNLDNLIIGKAFGSNALGYYDKAYKLMTYPNSMLTGVLSSSLHPILSNYCDKPNIIFEKYVKLLKTIMLFGIPIALVCFTASKEIVCLFYGTKWIESHIILRYLSLSVLFQMCLSSSGAIFQSIGRTDLLFKTGLINTLILISCMLCGLFLFNTTEAIAIFVSLGYISSFFVTYFAMAKYGFFYKSTVFFSNLKDYLIIYLSMLILINTISDLNNSNIMVSFLLKVLVISIIYFLFILIDYRVKKKKIHMED